MEAFPNILGLSISLAALWHVMGFAFGLVYVWQSTQSLLGRIAYDSRWSKILKNADYHLWISGAVLIVLGVLDKGSAIYFSNPKLLCKIMVVLFWVVLNNRPMEKFHWLCFSSVLSG